MEYKQGENFLAFASRVYCDGRRIDQAACDCYKNCGCFYCTDDCHEVNCKYSIWVEEKGYDVLETYVTVSIEGEKISLDPSSCKYIFRFYEEQRHIDSLEEYRKWRATQDSIKGECISHFAIDATIETVDLPKEYEKYFKQYSSSEFIPALFINLKTKRYKIDSYINQMKIIWDNKNKTEREQSENAHVSRRKKKAKK